MTNERGALDLERIADQPVEIRAALPRSGPAEGSRMCPCGRQEMEPGETFCDQCFLDGPSGLPHPTEQRPVDNNMGMETLRAKSTQPWPPKLPATIEEWASPVLITAIEERLSEMSSRESALAAANAQALFKEARRNKNLHCPWIAVARQSLDFLVGAWLNDTVERKR